MSAESEKSRDVLAEQLAAFDDRLQSMSGDVDMLADIQRGIGTLLSSGDNSEAEIRRVLQERLESGDLRKETFQLVKSMLDRFVTENVPTSPTASVVNPRPPAAEPAPPPPSFLVKYIVADQLAEDPRNALPFFGRDSRQFFVLLFFQQNLCPVNLFFGHGGSIHMCMCMRQSSVGMTARPPPKRVILW